MSHNAAASAVTLNVLLIPERARVQSSLQDTRRLTQQQHWGGGGGGDRGRSQADRSGGGVVNLRRMMEVTSCVSAALG